MGKIIIASIGMFIFVLLMQIVIESMVWKTLVGKWYFQSEIVKDPLFYGGEYVSINDSIRVVKKEESYCGGSKYVVQVKFHKDSTFRNTESMTYEHIHNGSKWATLRDLQSDWESRQRFFN